MNFILPHSFELDLPGIPLLSTLELLLFGHSNRCIRVTVLIMGDHLGRIYLNCQGIYSDRLYCFRIFDAQDRLFDLFCYTGETSRLWRASVLLLSESRQSVRTVRVPYRPSVSLLSASSQRGQLSFELLLYFSGFWLNYTGRSTFCLLADRTKNKFCFCAMLKPAAVRKNCPEVPGRS